LRAAVVLQRLRFFVPDEYFGASGRIAVIERPLCLPVLLAEQKGGDS
jgi:hypothetical protein